MSRLKFIGISIAKHVNFVKVFLLQDIRTQQVLTRTQFLE